MYMVPYNPAQLLGQWTRWFFLYYFAFYGSLCFVLVVCQLHWITKKPGKKRKHSKDDNAGEVMEWK